MGPHWKLATAEVAADADQSVPSEHAPTLAIVGGSR